MATVSEPGYAVLSGPAVRRNDCKRALEASGFTVLPESPLPADPSERPPHRGLPAYRNPAEAAEAGKPNSGHTPGSPHPESGDDYEDDLRIGFVDVRLPETEGALDEIVRVGQSARFGLRLHSPVSLVSIPDFTVEQRLEIAEAHLAAIRMDRLRASGVPLGAITNPPYVLQQSSHGAQLFREAVSSLIRPGGGMVDVGGFACTQNGSPNMSVNLGAGRIWVPGTSLATVNPGNGAYYPQGLYFAENDASVNVAVSASDPTNPRLDQPIVQIQDAAYAGATNSASLAILTGTPTAGAALNNLVGLASLPASSMLLNYVLVPANATSIVTADISAGQAPLAGAAGNDTGWVALTLATSPGSGLGAAAGYFTPSVRRIGDRAWLSGVIANNTGGNYPALTSILSTNLAAVFTPTSTVNVTAPVSTLSAADLQITTSGAIMFLGGVVWGNGLQLGLEGVSYRLV